MTLPVDSAPVRTGKFCNLLGPLSISHTSLGVGPLALKSIPSRVLLKIEFEEIELPTPPVTDTPLWLNAIVFRSSGAIPPITQPLPETTTPDRAFPGPGLMPVRSVPMKLPTTLLLSPISTIALPTPEFNARPRTVEFAAWTNSIVGPVRVPFIWTKDGPQPGFVVPSIITVSVIVGRGLEGEIVLPAILKTIVSVPARAF